MRTFIEFLLWQEHFNLWWIIVLLGVIVYLIYLQQMKRKTSSYNKYRKKMVICKIVVYIAINFITLGLALLMCAPLITDTFMNSLKMIWYILANGGVFAIVYTGLLLTLRLICMYIDIRLVDDTAIDYTRK